MPDTWWSPTHSLPAPAAPRRAVPQDGRATLIVDAWGVFVTDPDDGYLGRDAAAPPSRSLNAQRAGTRAL